MDIGALALTYQTAKGQKGIFDTKNLMHPQLASRGVLDNCNKGKKAQEISQERKKKELPKKHGSKKVAQ